MALTRIELIFYMEFDLIEEGRKEIKRAASEAIEDGLHEMTDATISQANKDNWSGSMIPYNRETDESLEDLLNQRVEKVNPVDSKETT